MPTILAIDQSTSATKALLYSADGELIDKVSIEHRQIYPQPGFVEHDALEIWNNTLAATEQVQIRNPARQRDLLCVSITNQRETFVVFDRYTGEPLCNAIVWQCRRGDPICDELRRGGHGDLVTKRTGLKIDTYFSAPKLAWLIRNNPVIAKKLADGDALFGTIDTYLIYRLTRREVFATDHTNASRTLLFNIHTLRWDEELCGIFGVPMRCLPEVRDSTGRFGETIYTASKLPLPICGVMGDSQASLFAHRCFAPGMAKVTLGSGSSVLLNIGDEAKSGGEGAVTTVAWTHQAKATYSFEGIISYAAATIGWLKDQLGLIQSPEECEPAACAIADNGGVYLVPAFAGLSAPYWSPGARAAIVGMSAHTNRNHIIRAALESIAYQLRDVLDAMQQRAGVKLSTIRADGGATRNRFLMQFIADMTGLEVSVSQMPDCSPLGAALAGAVGMGIHPTVEDLASLPREQVTYRPKMSAIDAKELHEGWQRAVKQVLAGAL